MYQLAARMGTKMATGVAEDTGFHDVLNEVTRLFYSLLWAETALYKRFAAATSSLLFVLLPPHSWYAEHLCSTLTTRSLSSSPWSMPTKTKTFAGPGSLRVLRDSSRSLIWWVWCFHPFYTILSIMRSLNMTRRLSRWKKLMFNTFALNEDSAVAFWNFGCVKFCNMRNKRSTWCVCLFVCFF